MAKFKFTNNAVEDLSDIWNYTLETRILHERMDLKHKLVSMLPSEVKK